MIIDDYIAYMQYELNLAALTVQAYAADLRQWRDFATSGGKYEFVAADVSTSDLRQWVAHLSSQGMGARSIKRKAAAVSGFYRWMMKRHGLLSNPAADLQLARPKKTLPAVIPESQTKKVLDDKPQEEDFIAIRNYLIIDMLYETGMRASELVNLVDANVDVQNCSLRVMGKRSKQRIIPFGPQLALQIEAYRKLRAKECETVSTPCLFVNKKGESIDYRTVLRAVHSALDGRVSSAKRSPHVLRHSFATDMLNSGADLNAIKNLLGHESLETTQIYTHISLSELKHNYELAHPRALNKGGHYGS